MDEFKKYLRENKSKMDVDEPGIYVWTNIRKQQKRHFGIFIQYAAAACLITIMAVGLYFLPGKKTLQTIASVPPVIKLKTDSNQITYNNQPAILQTKEQAIGKKSIKSFPVKKNEVMVFKGKRDAIDNNINDNSVAESFGQIQKSFAIIINHQLEKVKSTPLYGEDANYFSVFKKEFQDLNVDELGTRQDIISNGLSDVDIQKLINIYQQKILLLKRLQSEINKVNNHAPSNLDDKTKLKPTYINI